MVRPEKLKQTDSDSPVTGEPEFLVVGRIGKPHGVKGEVQFKVLTDFPERLTVGKQLFVGDKREPVTIMDRRGGVDQVILRLNNVSDREQAGFLRNQMVYVRASEVPDLPEGEFYFHELLGLSVETEDGEHLGLITEILATGANDVFVVRDEEGSEMLLPAINDVLLEIDLEKKRVLVHLLPGL